LFIYLADIQKTMIGVYELCVLSLLGDIGPCGAQNRPLLLQPGAKLQ